MRWIGEAGEASTLDGAAASTVKVGITTWTFEEKLDTKIAKAVLKILVGDSRKLVQLEEERRRATNSLLLSGRLIAFMIQSYFKISDIKLKSAVDSLWDETLIAKTKFLNLIITGN